MRLGHRRIVRATGVRRGNARATTTQSAFGLIALAALVAGVGLALRLVPPLGPASAAAQGAASPSAGTTVGGDATAGRDLFLANCASCHGSQGQGTAVAPDIRGAGAALADYVLRTGRMPLPDPKAPSERRQVIFTDDQIRALVAFVASLGNGPAIPDVAISGADLALGRNLFIENCAACHGATAGGGSVGGGFVAPNLHNSEPTTVAEAVTVGPGPMPRFRFPQDELNALVAYVQQLRSQASPGGLAIAQLGPVPEGFIAGFVGLVLLIVLIRWVGRRPVAEPDEDEAPTAEASTGTSTR